MHNLIQINEEQFDVKLDLRYATKNNFTKDKIYDRALCYLHPQALECLKESINLAGKKNFRIKIFDAFRPIESQEFLYEKFPDSGFVSNPKTGSIPHCRGIAIDLTLIDENDQELDMGTEFDHFSELAYHDCRQISELAQKNRLLLKKIMLDSGWDFYQQEWWHYQLFNPNEYPVIHGFRV